MVNTFLPFADYGLCVKVLFWRHLGKQRVEASQIIDVLEGKTKGYKNHTAVKTWEGYTDSLKLYYNCCVKEWIRRGYKNNMPLFELEDYIQHPYWLGWEAFHVTHRVSLLVKNKEHYSDKLHIPAEYSSFSTRGYIWPSDVPISKREEAMSDISVSLSYCREPKKTWTREELVTWSENQSYNPTTGAKISTTSKKGIYSNLMKAAKKHNITVDKREEATTDIPTHRREPKKTWTREELVTWSENPGYNPVTGRKISTTSKKGIYSDLLKAAKKHNIVIK